MRSLVRAHREEGGASLVEFAILAPLLILLVLGIVEFGWLFGQYNEVRHAVRETARYAAVSNPDRNGGGVDDSDVIDVACDTLNLAGGSFDLTVTATDTNGDSVVGQGDTGTVTITAIVPSLTNLPLVTVFLPSDITNAAEFRLEQPALWTSPINVVGSTC